MAEENKNNKEWNFSMMGKQTHKDFYKVKPKVQAKQSGCTNCSHVISRTEPLGSNPPPGGYTGAVWAIELASGTATLLVNFDKLTGPSPLGPSSHPGYQVQAMEEVARWGNKFVVNFGGITPTSSLSNQFFYGYLEFTIVTGPGGTCTTDSFVREISFDASVTATVYNFIPHSQAMIDQNTVIGYGIDYTISTTGVPCIGAIDISGTTAIITQLFNNPDTTGGGDLVYLPYSNSIVAINNISGTVFHWDMNGNNIGSPLTGFTPMANYAMWANDGKIYMDGGVPNDGIRVLEVDFSGQLQNLGIIPDFVDTTYNLTDNAWFGGDAAMDSNCASPPPSPPSCMDPTALNYDPLAIADCNGVVGGNDTSCCEYPCHHPHGWEPPV